MTESEMIEKLKASQHERRFNHTLGVAKEARRIAGKYGADQDKAYLTALLHDCAKNLDEYLNEDFLSLSKKYGAKLDWYAEKENALVHAFLGAEVARKDYNIDDEEILNAIYYHTTARENMTLLEKVIYVADMTEPGRTMEQADTIRELVEKSLDEAVIYSLGCSIKHVIKKGMLIHPYSVEALNYLIGNRRYMA